MAISHKVSLSMILSIFFLTQSSAKNLNTPLIHKTCKKIAAENPNISFKFCSAALHFATKHSHRHAADLRRLGLLSIGLVRSDVSSTRHWVKNLLRNKKVRDRRIRSSLADCLELYSDAHPLAKRAMAEYRLKRYGDANVAISTVMTGATTCEDGFKEIKGASSILKLKKRNEEAFELGAISLAIMKLIA